MAYALLIKGVARYLNEFDDNYVLTRKNRDYVLHMLSHVQFVAYVLEAYEDLDTEPATSIVNSISEYFQTPSISSNTVAFHNIKVSLLNDTSRQVEIIRAHTF